MRKTKPALKNSNDVVYIPEIPTKLLQPKSVNQSLLIAATCNSSIVFASGPAGTGKTYVAGSKALDMLQAGIIKQIILTRPYVSAGESYGHLPGTIDEKIEPYLLPYKQVFIDRIGKSALNAMLADGRIQAIPIGFLQGLTFDGAVILVDEAENATEIQIRLILTRLGEGSRCFLMGDEEQSYIRNSGFTGAMHILRNVPGLSVVKFDVSDVVRSNTCRDVLMAYAEAKA